MQQARPVVHADHLQKSLLPLHAALPQPAPYLLRSAHLHQCMAMSPLRLVRLGPTRQFDWRDQLARNRHWCWRVHCHVDHPWRTRHSCWRHAFTLPKKQHHPENTFKTTPLWKFVCKTTPIRTICRQGKGGDQ